MAGGINLFVYVHNDPVNNIDPYGLYDGTDFLFDGFTGDHTEGYYDYEEDLKEIIIYEIEIMADCMTECALDYVFGDASQRATYRAAKALVKFYAGLAILKKANTVVTYASVYGLIKCSVTCCD